MEPTFRMVWDGAAILKLSWKLKWSRNGAGNYGSGSLGMRLTVVWGGNLSLTLPLKMVLRSISLTSESGRECGGVVALCCVGKVSMQK